MKKMVFLFVMIAFMAMGCTGGSGGGTSDTQTYTSQTRSESYAIEGRLDGDVIEGVTITLSGPSVSETTTDENGFYSFEGLQEGTYTVTPSKEDYNFDPSSFEVELSEESTTKEVDISAEKKALFGEAKWGEAKWN